MVTASSWSLVARSSQPSQTPWQYNSRMTNSARLWSCWGMGRIAKQDRRPRCTVRHCCSRGRFRSSSRPPWTVEGAMRLTAAVPSGVYRGAGARGSLRLQETADPLDVALEAPDDGAMIVALFEE